MHFRIPIMMTKRLKARLSITGIRLALGTEPNALKRAMRNAAIALPGNEVLFYILFHSLKILRLAEIECVICDFVDLCSFGSCGEH